MTEIDWKKLSHAHGPATRVPSKLKQLVGKNADKRVDAFDTLRDTLVAESQWFAASAPVVEWLLNALPKAPEPDLVLTLVAEIVGADHVRAWLSPANEVLPKEAQACVAVALAYKDELLAILKAKKGTARAAVALLLAMLPQIAERSRSSLASLAQKDPDEVVRASALLALGRIGIGDAMCIRAVESALNAEQPLVRGAAAITTLRMDPTRAYEALADGIYDWLSWQPPEWSEKEVWLPWFGGLSVAWYNMNQKLHAPPHALAALAKATDRRDELCQTALMLAERKGLGVAARRLASIVLDSSDLGNRNKAEVALFSELSPVERVVATGLARTTLLPTGGYGLPGCGAARRRWAELAPPGPLEQPTNVVGSSVHLPFWRAFGTLKEKTPNMPGIPSPLDEMVEGTDRWQVIAELASGTYDWGCGLSPESLDRELARFEQSDDFFRRVQQVVNDLANRLEAARRDEVSNVLFGHASAWLLAPVVRAGRPVDSRWEVLVLLGAGQWRSHSREVFSGLSLERREAKLRSHLNHKLGPTTHSIIEEVIEFADLAPTVGVVTAILDTIDAYSPRTGADPGVLLQRLEQLGQEHPELGAGIRAARHARS